MSQVESPGDKLYRQLFEWVNSPDVAPATVILPAFESVLAMLNEYADSRRSLAELSTICYEIGCSGETPGKCPGNPNCSILLKLQGKKG